MSTYINPQKPNMRPTYDDCPPLVVEFLKYTQTIRGLSARTVNGYYIDLRTFFKYLVMSRGLVNSDVPLSEINLANHDIDVDFIDKVNKAEIYDFLYYVTKERENSAATRARKLSSLKGLFKYLTSKTGTINQNPTSDIETPTKKKRLPKYLSLEESMELLKNIQSDFYERDYCIIMFFLNCGMRLSELVGISLLDIKDDTLRIIGKGDKERTIFLNSACVVALDTLLEERAKIKNINLEPAVFVSKRTGKRLSARRVQQIVNNCLQAAGLSGKGYSVHKLRHTAATLLYQYGQVDMLVLKEILGHEDLSTTQIYTHLDAVQLKEAASISLFANVEMSDKKVKKEKEKTDENNVENSVENVEKSEKIK